MDDPNLNIAAIISLGEIARNGCLIYENFDKKLEIVEKLNKKILTSKETNKLKEKAAATLGYICIHENFLFEGVESDYLIEGKKIANFNMYVMQKLLDSSQAKQIELHMAIGEALVNCALGKKSTASLNTWINKPDDENTVVIIKENEDDQADDNLKWLLNILLNNYIASQNQHLRQASCFWLLQFVKKSSKCSPLVVKNLYKIQDAFIQRLGENDEITQEVASKGIGVIFSLADEEQKKLLVTRLVDTLSGGASKKKAAAASSSAITSNESGLKINDVNEEIFQPDQIGKTPDGGNITTYKELCSLASDLNRLVVEN